MESYELFMWVGFAFARVGYVWASVRAFQESTRGGWRGSICFPINFIFAYIYAERDAKPLLCYGAALSLWIISYVVHLVSSVAHVAPWHGFELAA